MFVFRGGRRIDCSRVEDVRDLRDLRDHAARSGLAWVGSFRGHGVGGLEEVCVCPRPGSRPGSRPAPRPVHEDEAGLECRQYRYVHRTPATTYALGSGGSSRENRSDEHTQAESQDSRPHP